MNAIAQTRTQFADATTQDGVGPWSAGQVRDFLANEYLKNKAKSAIEDLDVPDEVWDSSSKDLADDFRFYIELEMMVTTVKQAGSECAIPSSGSILDDLRTALPFVPSGLDGNLVAVDSSLKEEQTDKMVESAVLSALSNPKWDFRTVAGIARDTGIDELSVRSVLEDSPSVRKLYVPNSDGSVLYAPSNRRKSMRERLAEARFFLTKSL